MHGGFITAMAIAAVASAADTFFLIKSDAVCDADGPNLGNEPTLDACASACEATASCHFFQYEALTQSCKASLTRSPSCPEGFLLYAGHSFYQIQRGGAGCMNQLADNYAPDATLAGPCQSADACLDAPCHNCLTSGQCTEDRCTSSVPCKNLGYRNAQNDTIFASHIADGQITIDGDLQDWVGHAMERCYENVAFADKDGNEVVFESYGDGTWFGAADFSVRFMLRWDASNLYLAAEATDDDLQVRALRLGL